MKVAHAPGSETSRESAALLQPHVGHVDLMVLRELNIAVNGFTRYELAERTGLLLSTICGCVDRLKKRGKAVILTDHQTGKKRTRLSPSRRNVEIVYAVTKLTPEQLAH